MALELMPDTLPYKTLQATRRIAVMAVLKTALRHSRLSVELDLAHCSWPSEFGEA